MLMPDPGRALRETRRVLRDQGRLVFSVFAGPEHNPWMTVARGAMVARGHMSPPAVDEPGMFSLADPDRIRTLLSEAGFPPSEVEAMDIEFRFDDADALWSYTNELQGPIALANRRARRGRGAEPSARTSSGASETSARTAGIASRAGS